MSNEKSRNDKIKLLRDIAAGKTTIDEAFPQPTEIWYCPDGKTYNKDMGSSGLSEEEFNDLPPYRGTRLVLKLAEGCEPLSD